MGFPEIDQLYEIEQSLKTMYVGYVASEYSDDASRLERTVIAYNYNQLLSILTEIRKEKATK